MFCALQYINSRELQQLYCTFDYINFRQFQLPVLKKEINILIPQVTTTSPFETGKLHSQYCTFQYINSGELQTLHCTFSILSFRGTPTIIPAECLRYAAPELNVLKIRGKCRRLSQSPYQFSLPSPPPPQSPLSRSPLTSLPSLILCPLIILVLFSGHIFTQFRK